MPPFSQVKVILLCYEGYNTLDKVWMGSLWTKFDLHDYEVNDV
jgi:hypothetical protein